MRSHTRNPAKPSNWWQTALFGAQHVVVMYTGCVTVPLVFGAAMGLDKHTVGILVNADLLIAGLSRLCRPSVSASSSAQRCR